MSTSTTTTCKARQVSDQMSCSRCGYVWDVNDPDPPTCKTDNDLNQDKGRKCLNALKEKLG